ncbi:tyrosine-type recombinase/integrase [Vibrio sp. 10N]|uniref:tyrosine-type recombinase/integrase n=1 Tax=Vibrio sp. 10N TaxID=3058938 RepID=UPI002812EA4E|nr:tyrosine-type recombinase/integrase [Vibrio sp. 10N]
MKKDIPRITESDQANKFKGLLRSSISYQEFGDMTSNCYSRSTNLAMSKDWRTFNEFCQLRSHPSLPASEATMLEFIDHTKQEKKYSSVRRYLVTISVVHYLFDYKDPTRSRHVGLAMNKLKIDSYNKVKQTTAFTTVHLDQLYQKLIRSDEKKDCRDLAIYFLLYECALKRRELKSLMAEDISSTDNSYTVTLDDKTYPLSEQAGECVKRWMEHVPYSVLFRAIDRHGNISDSALDDSSIHRVLKRASNLLGLDATLSLSSQSGRVGVVQELTKEGHKIRDIQEFGRWASPAMPLQYSGKATLSEEEKSLFKTNKNND